jgi:hypothetical protein
MTSEIDNDTSEQEYLDFNQYIQLNKKARSEPKQVTVCKYKTNENFNIQLLSKAIKQCYLKANDEFGIIKESISDDKKMRALFALIGETTFRRANITNRSIDNYVMQGALKCSFLVEYYEQENNKLGFFTYGDSKYFNKVQEKHKIGFGKSIDAELVEFGYDRTRDICLKFKNALKLVRYEPHGQEDYGNTDSATLKKTNTYGKKTLDNQAKIVKDVLFNKDISLDTFEGYIDSIDPKITTKNIHFKLSKTGSITLFLPELKLSNAKWLTEIEAENKLYDFVKKSYTQIISEDWISMSGNVQPAQQEIDIDSFFDSI